MHLIQPPTHEIAPGVNASVREYELAFRNDIGLVVIERVQSSKDCTEVTCTHSFIPESANGSSYHVTVAARNAVTLGQQQTCTQHYCLIQGPLPAVSCLLYLQK